MDQNPSYVVVTFFVALTLFVKQTGFLEAIVVLLVLLEISKVRRRENLIRIPLSSTTSTMAGRGLVGSWFRLLKARNRSDTDSNSDQKNDGRRCLGDLHGSILAIAGEKGDLVVVRI
jgi:hypothetical protein